MKKRRKERKGKGGRGGKEGRKEEIQELAISSNFLRFFSHLLQSAPLVKQFSKSSLSTQEKYPQTPKI